MKGGREEGPRVTQMDGDGKKETRAGERRDMRERRDKNRKGKERKGKERKGKERRCDEVRFSVLPPA